MPKYKVNARFGPWDVGDEFESETEFHANLAAEGRLLLVMDDGKSSEADDLDEPFDEDLIEDFFNEDAEEDDPPQD